MMKTEENPVLLSGLYQSIDRLESGNIVTENATVELKAGKSILFKPGMEVELGGELSAEIEDCVH